MDHEEAVWKKLPKELRFWIDRLDEDATKLEAVARGLLRE